MADVPARARHATLPAVFTVLGVVTATPVFALIDPGVLTWTYGVASRDPMIVALLQHRGVLQLALGAAIVWAGFRRELRVAVALTAVVTKATFLALLLPSPATRSDLAPFSIWFDALCIAFFVGYTAIALVRGRRRGALA